MGLFDLVELRDIGLEPRRFKGPLRREQTRKNTMSVTGID